VNASSKYPFACGQVILPAETLSARPKIRSCRTRLILALRRGLKLTRLESEAGIQREVAKKQRHQEMEPETRLLFEAVAKQAT
jgi:hypothetical protein